MGTGRELKCKECGKTFNLNFGIGFLYPDACRQARKAALNGELGEEWKKIISENPYYVVETKRYLYWCPNCHCIDFGEELSIYKPKDLESLLKQQRGEKTVEEWGYDPWGVNEETYELVKEFVRECPRCKTKMDRKDEEEIDGLELVCPECGGKLEDTGNCVMWD